MSKSTRSTLLFCAIALFLSTSACGTGPRATAQGDEIPEFPAPSEPNNSLAVQDPNCTDGRAWSAEKEACVSDVWAIKAGTYSLIGCFPDSNDAMHCAPAGEWAFVNVTVTNKSPERRCLTRQGASMTAAFPATNQLVEVPLGSSDPQPVTAINPCMEAGASQSGTIHFTDALGIDLRGWVLTIITPDAIGASTTI